MATRAVHALVQMVDANGRSFGQGVVALPLPWLEQPGAAGAAPAEARPFEAELLHRGQCAGRLCGRMVASFGR